jgi:hypothetical protein
MRATYENIIVCCPWCGRENIFNRASDLKDVPQPIEYAEVRCLLPDCAKPFYLNGDLTNSAYEMLVFDCYELLERKHYSYCILNLAQAFEVFFSQYLRVELLYKAFACDLEKNDADIVNLNRLMKRLYEKIENLAFSHMRYLFFYQVLHPPHPSSLRQAEGVIEALPCKGKVVLPSDDSIRNATIFSNKRVPEILVRLRSCNVPKLRNNVVHKSAYRPTLGEVNDALKETREILFPLGQLLDVRIDDVDHYVRPRT